MALMLGRSVSGFASGSSSPTSTASTGTTITASATTHTKGSWTQVIASTSADAYAIIVSIQSTAASNADSSTLLDIGVGASGSETVLIPDLAAGYSISEAASTTSHMYLFPIFIPAGSRLSARSQSVVASKTASLRLQLLHQPMVGNWVGSRVTAYGVASASSRGTVSTSGSNAWGSTAELSASTSDPIRYVQVGMQAGGSAALTDRRVMLRLTSGSSVLSPELFAYLDTGTESTGFGQANLLLAACGFNLPAGISLGYQSQSTAAVNTIDLIAYGVS